MTNWQAMLGGGVISSLIILAYAFWLRADAAKWRGKAQALATQSSALSEKLEAMERKLSADISYWQDQVARRERSLSRMENELADFQKNLGQCLSVSSVVKQFDSVYAKHNEYAREARGLPK